MKLRELLLKIAQRKFELLTYANVHDFGLDDLYIHDPYLNFLYSEADNVVSALQGKEQKIRTMQITISHQITSPTSNYAYGRAYED